jgi:hypothetical protein
MKNIKELVLKGNKFTIKGGLKNIYKIEESESKTGKSHFLGKCFGVDSEVSMFEACLSKINDNSFTYFSFIMDRKVSGRVYFKDLTLVGNE